MSKKAVFIILAVAMLIAIVLGIGIGIKDGNIDVDQIIMDNAKPKTIEFNIENETYKITMPANLDYAIQKIDEKTFVIAYAIGGTPIAEDHQIHFVKELPNDNFEKIKNSSHTSFTVPKTNGEVAIYKCTRGELDGTTCFLITFSNKNHFVYFETSEGLEKLKELAQKLSFE